MPKAKASSNAKRGKGRPSRFGEAIAAKILALAAGGATDAQIAAELGIGLTTLKNWKGKHADFRTALKAAKDAADDLVVSALFRAAVGYSHPAVKIHFDAKAGKFMTQAYTEHYPPNAVACLFWLKNRQPDKWREAKLPGDEDGDRTIKLAYAPKTKETV